MIDYIICQIFLNLLNQNLLILKIKKLCILENFRKKDYVYISQKETTKEIYYSIRHKPMIKPKNTNDINSSKLLTIIIDQNTMRTHKNVYKVKKIDNDDKKLELPELNIYRFNIEELKSENIKELRINIYREKYLKDAKTHRYIIHVSDLKPGYYLESKYFKINYPILFSEYVNHTFTSYNIKNKCHPTLLHLPNSVKHSKQSFKKLTQTKMDLFP